MVKLKVSFKKSMLLLVCCCLVVVAGVWLNKAVKKRALFPLYPEYVVDIGKSYKEDITFLVADVRYKEGSLKFLELGEGVFASFREYDDYHSRRGIVWERFWGFLRQFGLPVWFVSKNFSGRRMVNARKRYAIDDFEKNGWQRCLTLTDLEKRPDFVACHQKNLDKLPGKLPYKGIIISCCRHGRVPSQKELLCQCPKCSMIRNFKNRYKDFLFLDDASSLYTSNKSLMATLFVDEQLSSFRPKYKIIKKRYRPTLAHELIQQFACDRFVIKPINSMQGRGVMVVDANNLDMMLKYIIDEPYRFKDAKDSSHQYWFVDKNDVLIVESCESSKHIKVENKWYDPTLRIMCALYYLDGKIHINFLGEFWKLPAKSLDQRCSLTELYKDDNLTRVVSVNPHDVAGVHALMKIALPLIYEKMLQRTDPFTMLHAYIDAVRKECDIIDGRLNPLFALSDFRTFGVES